MAVLYARTVLGMQEEVPGLTCTCGAENFVHVVVKRPQRPTHVTDFVACANCAAVYYVPGVAARREANR